MSLHHSAIGLLSQINSVISQLSDHQYKQALPVLSDSSIGQHVRHTLEFFLCLMDGHHENRLNYDNRNHDPFIEQETALARSIIESIMDFLKKEPQDAALVMEANYALEHEAPVEIPSSFYRELAYNIEHAIHHMALIKVGIKAAFPGIALPGHFGVASSTVRYKIQRDS